MNKLSKILSITTATLISLSLSTQVYAANLDCNSKTTLNCKSKNNCNVKILNNNCKNIDMGTINNILLKYGLGDICKINYTKINTPNIKNNIKITTPSTKKTSTPNNKTVNNIEKPTEKTPVKLVEKNNTEVKNTFSQYQQEVLNLVNIERNKAGLKSLKLNTDINKVATAKSQDMVNKNYFSHTSPTYGSPFDMMSKFGISYRTAGENIAMGQRTPSEVMNGWMNSSGHRANILNGNFTDLGVGIAKDSNGRIYWTQMFIGK